MTEMSKALEVDDRVDFRLCDSQFRSTGVIVKVNDNYDATLEAHGIDYDRYTYDVRDDRHGWTHRLGVRPRSGGLRKIEPKPERPAVSDETWDGKF